MPEHENLSNYEGRGEAEQNGFAKMASEMPSFEEHMEQRAGQEDNIAEKGDERSDNVRKIEFLMTKSDESLNVRSASAEFQAGLYEELAQAVDAGDTKAQNMLLEKLAIVRAGTDKLLDKVEFPDEKPSLGDKVGDVIENKLLGKFYLRQDVREGKELIKEIGVEGLRKEAQKSQAEAGMISTILAGRESA